MEQWSLLYDTFVGEMAKLRMSENGLPYHNWEHVCSMFDYLQATGYPYNSTLDLAILYHDVIYDSRGQKEDRSAEYLQEMAEMHSRDFEGLDIDGAEYLIYETIDHRIGERSSSNSRAIIRADLHQLSSGLHTLQNFEKILQESKWLYGATLKQFSTANENFMKGLKTRIALNGRNDPGYEEFWQDVERGVDDTIYLARMIERNT